MKRKLFRRKIVDKFVGKVLIAYSFLLLVPILVSFVYREDFVAFLVPFVISLILGILLNNLKTGDSFLYAKDGFIIVAKSWVIISLISALPFYISGSASFVDSVFEAVSGLTTTGATIFSNVEGLDKCLLFWRSFIHFVGGMGVLTFVMAVVPLSKNDKSMHVLKAEMPGPSVSKFVPSLKKTISLLYIIYLVLTLLEIGLLMIGGESFFNSLLIAMSTAGTGGFAYLNSSLATISIFNKYVVGIFMLLFGVNFNIYFLLLYKDFKTILKSEELRWYIGIFVISVLIIFFSTYSLFSSKFEGFTEAFFHVSSILTSTGFSIGNINIYPTYARSVMLFLMVVSACAGSTCGGFKVARLVLCIKTIRRDFRKLIHPQMEEVITFEGKKVEEDILKNTNTFLFIYVILLLVIIFLIGFNGYDLETTINAVFCTFANVGLCFNISSFGGFSIFSKIVLSIGMLLGRLEIFPILVWITNFKNK